VIDLKNVGLPEHGFYSIVMPFLGFNLNNECYGSSSFDSYSVNDKQQLQIILFYRCCTCMVNSSIGMLLPE
jgi:hypothetical protein